MIRTRERKRRAQVVTLFQIAVFLHLASVHLRAQSDPEPPTWSQVTQIAVAELAQRKGYQAGDLLTFDDIEGVLVALAVSGWQPRDQQRILEDTLADSDALAQILRTEHGTRFMRKVSQDSLIFDRMDRVCRVSGGQRMLRDISRLPDGEKLAKLHRPHGTPGFLDLLPKNASGKVRSIRNYDKPTGRIYTQEQLLRRLQESYRGQSDQVAGNHLSQ